ncbi:MAG: MltA domain-containing protein [Burkholderiaceae bacterium]|jgi:membrane-bound lytic murein transglycosylase A|nr:MltA domain-containing protein [Burkholderiaceae bacterium]MEB2319047.1 MltA domain-containing protein [Pseudomonadota bacterium]
MRSPYRLALLALTSIAIGLAGCASPPVAATAIPPGALPGWEKDDLGGIAQALDAQCALARPPGHWARTCAMLPEPSRLRGFIEANFLAWPMQAPGDVRPGMLTGYHEPLLTGSRNRESSGQVPLYAPPAPPRDGTLLPDRAAIDAGALAATPVVAWADDPVEAFFLHVQGSGRLRLRDGSILRIGFAGHNGRPYRSIGRELIERGELDAATLDADAIKAWLRAHPGEATAVMQSNPRYVFFRVLEDVDPQQGPIGSLGVPLTTMRSIATDPARVPPGALVYLDAAPLAGDEDSHHWRRLGVAQDTGAAIRGAVRADLFAGSDSEAASIAARLRQPLAAWLLLPRGEEPRR